MTGRKQHPVWLCFTRDSSCRTNIKGKCKGCGEVVQGLVGRLEKHASCCRRLAALGLFGADHFARCKLQNIGCCAHWLNLLMKDIAKDQTAVLERVVEVLRWFRNNHQAAACLRQRELALPPLPSTTRWNSHAESLAYFNKH